MNPHEDQTGTCVSRFMAGNVTRERKSFYCQSLNEMPKLNERAMNVQAWTSRDIGVYCSSFLNKYRIMCQMPYSPQRLSHFYQGEQSRGVRTHRSGFPRSTYCLASTPPQSTSILVWNMTCCGPGYLNRLVGAWYKFESHTQTRNLKERYIPTFDVAISKIHFVLRN